MRKLFLDFDNTLVNTTSALTSILNMKYGKNVYWKDIRKWNLQDGFPTTNPEEIENIFKSYELFHHLSKNIYPDCIEVLNKLKEIGRAHV
jgi:5'(3')-deoxyribonucleotidase